MITRLKRSAVLLAAAVTVGGMVAAPVAAHEAHGHPAKLHEGTCQELGRVAVPLNGVGGDVDVAGTPVAESEAVNSDRPYQVLRSETDVAAALDELLAAPHALMIYESDEDLQAISCGDLGGNRLDDELAVGLAEIGVPGHTGIALLEGHGNTTRVRIFLGHALSPISAGEGAEHDHASDTVEDADHHDEPDDFDHDVASATSEAGS